MTDQKSSEGLIALGELITTQKGFAFKSAWFSKEGRKIVKVSNFSANSVDLSSLAHISEELAQKHERYQLATGDILIQTVGSWPSNPASVVGKVVRVPCGVEGALLNQNAVKLTPLPGVHNGYLYYALKSSAFSNYIVGTAQGAANQASITLDSIKGYCFNLLSFPTQHRIASILSAYDELIENNTRRIKILEEMARRLYEEWFVQFRFPGYEEVGFEESELGLIPEGWEVVALERAVEINPKTKVDRDDKKVFVPMGALSETGMVVSGCEIKSGNSGSKFQNGDTLVARISPCLENGKTGFVDFLPASQPTACGSTEFIVLRSRSLCPEMVYCLARSERLREVAMKSMSGATGRQRVRVESLVGFLIAHPNGELIAKYHAFAQPCFREIRILANKNENLRAQRDLLLPKLISGEIDVSYIPMPT
jgi:type I restriction enzyme S subunit